MPARCISSELDLCHTAAPRCLAYADGSHLNKNVKTKGSAAGGNLSQVHPLIPGTSVF